MTRMRTSRLITASVAGLLGTAAFVGGTMTAATADAASGGTVTYTCTSPLGTITSTLQVALPAALTAPATPFAAGEPVPSTDGLTGAITLSKDIISQLQGFGIAGMQGSFAGTSGVGDATQGGPVPAPLSLTIPNTPIAANNADGSETIPVTGTLGAFNPSGTDTQNVTAPKSATFTLDVGLGSPIPVPCTLNSDSTSTPLGAIPFTGTDTKSVHLTPSLKGNTFTVNAQTGWADGAAPGTGTVKVTGKVKVGKTVMKGKKKVTTYTTKAITVSKQLNNGSASLPVKLPKGTKKGSYKFTVTWDGVSKSATIKVK